MRQVIRRWPTSKLAKKRSSRRDQSEDGDTLLEILLTVVVLGLSSVALMTAFSTSISASAEQRDLVTINNLVRSGSEFAFTLFQQSSVTPYVSCAPASTYNPGGAEAITFAPPSGYSEQITSVEYLENGVFGSSCTAGSTQPQLLTLSVTGPHNTGGSNSFVVQDAK